MVSNLLGNAVRHSKPEPPIAVHVDGCAAEQVTLVISNGGEIPSEALPALFAPFRDKDPRKKHGEGLGLGLFIVSEIVHAHGGTVQVCSQTGNTAFTVLLPRTPKLGEAAERKG